MRGGLLVAALMTGQCVGDMLPCSSSLPFRGPVLQENHFIGVVIKLLNIIDTLKTHKNFWKALKCFEAWEDIKITEGAGGWLEPQGTTGTINAVTWVRLKKSDAIKVTEHPR